DSETSEKKKCPFDAVYGEMEEREQAPLRKVSVRDTPTVECGATFYMSSCFTQHYPAAVEAIYPLRTLFADRTLFLFPADVVLLRRPPP
ncbi:hypothetical protein AVEN_111870-2-1, partial [Araneus ventricosus]